MAEMWPSTLQQLLSEASFGIEEGDTTIRSEVDVGLAKVRRRFTKGVDRYSASIYLTVDQYTTFKNFFNVTLNGGVLTFNFNDPITQELSEYRFVGAPQYSSLGGGNFTASFTWEKIP